LQIEGRSLDVFVQVNTSNEDSKFGLPPEEVHAFVRELPQFFCFESQRPDDLGLDGR